MKALRNVVKTVLQEFKKMGLLIIFTGGKRLIKNLYKKYHHFADIIVADVLYCKSTWIKEVLAIGMDTVVRVKDERQIKNGL